MKIDAKPLENLCSLGSIPKDGETVDCSDCGRTCDRLTVQLCRARGPNPQPAVKAERPEPVASGGCCGQSPTLAKVQRPGWFRKATTFAGSMLKYVTDGRQDRSPEEQATNLAICSTCPLLGKDGSCDGCGCVISEKVKMRLEACPAGKWFEDVRPTKPIADPVRNLLHCCLPVESSKMWRWNLDQLANRQNVFNGKRVLAIIEEPSEVDIEHKTRKLIKGRQIKTVSASEVLAYCDKIGLRFDAVQTFVNNPRLGEVVAFKWLLDQVQSLDPNEITFYCHSKGVTRFDGEDNAERWAERMYRACLDDMQSAERALEQFAFAGAFLRKTPLGRSTHHFSGTFFWGRNATWFNRPEWTKIDQEYYGTESYPGGLVKRDEMACLAHDNAGNIYSDDEWSGRLAREIEVWEGARMGERVSAAIIITCGPGYDRWVRDAIQSAVEQEGFPEIVCVFDKCEPISDLPGRVKPLRVDHGSVQLARRAGAAATTGEVLFFLDADNAYSGKRFVIDAVQQLRAASAIDKRVAGLSVDIEYHDMAWKPKGHTLVTPDWDRERFDRENFLDASVPVWRHALEASWHTTQGNGSHEDYHTWRQLVLDGWTFSKGKGLTLRYRFCPDSSSSQPGQGNYAARYRLHEQPLTMFVPLSGRSWAWPAMRDWLAEFAATDRGKSIRLVLADTSGDDQFGAMIRRDAGELPFEEVRVYRQSVASPGLADADRFKHERAVQLACARIYNRFAQECQTHLALIIEDDILPQLSGEETLRKMIDGMGEHHVGMSGVYHDRRNGGVNSWSSANGKQVQRLTTAQVDAAGEGYLPIKGTGFGCLLIRRETLRAAPLALPPGELWYDPCFFNAVLTGQKKLALACGVRCDHREPSKPGGEREFNIDWFTRGVDQWEQHALPLAGRPLQLLEVGSYEGRSACWMADNLLSHPESRLLCIDAGIGVGSREQLQQLRANLDTLPNRGQIELRIGSSFEVLPTLKPDSYDVIYIDGSHLGGDTIRDLCNAWPLLKSGGLMYIDDYQFEENGIEPREWAGPAIDYWLDLRGSEIEVLHVGWQVVIRRA